jgi:5'(3')-deoxyribonucleotidase
MEHKPVLFVDIDGVVADAIPWWLTLYNRDHGTSHKKSDVTEWDTRVCIKADLSRYFYNYDHVDPVDGAMAAIHILGMKYRIVYATMGNGSDWISRYFYRPEVVICKNTDKSILHGIALIDDNQANLEVFSGERFLLSQPWNTGRGLNDFTWEQITKYLMNL